MGDRARYEIEDRVAVVTLDNPPVNALDVETKEALARTFVELEARQGEVLAVVLHGGGEKAFAAGADIKAFLDLTPETARRRLERSHELTAPVEDFPRPVIAAIHGFCLGGGLELALCCDIRYADETAQFGFPEVNLSIFPGNGGTRRALYHVPLGRLKELVFTGDMIGPQEAERYGLVQRVVPAGQAVDAAKETARKIARKGPLAVAAAKQVLNRTRDLTLAQGLALETALWSALAATEDMKEGARAFLEKRKPQYRNR